ncbi:4'-phosphopantetheinyl transferase superfamily protein [Lachnospira pectinoschiza]|uniref:4'-phosphopantetheinyl transferase superfamily protein n=1 Tax=Lachnospira pectinoschiza TaxID=28052 RepID=UPI0009F72A00
MIAFYTLHKQTAFNFSPDKERAFFEIWTKKEAYTKCIGTGLSVDLKSINTLSASINNNIITFTKNEYMCSVCVIKNI